MTPLDQIHRHRIHDDVHTGLFVEAGAGTGKTTAMVGRIVSIVQRGSRLTTLVAITFTEKAAGELRDRVRAALEQARSAAEDDEAAHRLDQALEDLEGARIQTIDSFALSLLMAYPIQAGLPPAVRLVDEFAAQVAFDDWWEATLGDLLADPTLTYAWATALDAGLRTASLKELAAYFSRNWHQPTEPLDTDLPARLGTLVTRMCQDGERLVELIAGCSSPTDSLYTRVANLAPWLAALTQAGTDPSLLARLPTCTISPQHGKASNWQNVDIKGLIADLKAFKVELTDRLPGIATLAIAAPILERLRRAALQYADDRRLAGTLTFADVMALARNLLLNCEEAREDLRRQTDYLMIDEFQDTDPLQLEIAALIAAAEQPGGDFHWSRAPIERDRLFLVGDPKQAIYRFRSADIDSYLAAMELFEENQRVPLTVNFRSRGPLLDWFNSLFRELFQEQAGQVPYRDLDTAHHCERPAVVLLRPDKAAGVAAERRNDEAAQIAATVETARARGWAVRGEHGGERAARYGDMAVLIPTRTCLGAIERALTAQFIPYRIECQSLLWESREAREILEALTVLDDPSDRVAAVACLRSSLFGCTDLELFQFSEAGGRWNCESRANDALEDGPVKRALYRLRDLRSRTRSLPVNETLDLLLREQCAMEAAFAHARPRDAWQRQRLLLDQARAFHAAGGATLGQFLTWARAQQKADVRVNESIVPERDDDAVRILTIHAAKGLEFPIVLLAGLGGAPRPSAPVALRSVAGLLELNLGALKSPGAAEAIGRERAHERLESARLLYVAATRARDYLAIGLHYKETSNTETETRAQIVDRLHTQLGLVSLDPANVPGLPPEPIRAAAAAPYPRERDSWMADLADVPDALLRMPALAATTIASMRVGESEGGEATLHMSRSRGRGGTAFGRAVHAALQAADLSDPEAGSVRALAALGAEGEGIPAQAEAIERAVRSALRAPILREAAAAKHYREVFLSTCCGGVAVEGFIDLIFEDAAGEWVVVDYKTDNLDDPSQAMQRYSHQAAAYALLVREQLGRLPARCVFLFVNAPSEKSAVPVDGLAERVRDLEEWLARGTGAALAATG